MHDHWILSWGDCQYQIIKHIHLTNTTSQQYKEVTMTPNENGHFENELYTDLIDKTSEIHSSQPIIN